MSMTDDLLDVARAFSAPSRLSPLVVLPPESVQAVLRLFETPSDAATFLCAYNERMHVASKGRSS